MRVDSLLIMCVSRVGDHADSYLADIRTLPVHIKDLLLERMKQKYQITDMNIGQLLHPGIKELGLCSCRVSDSALRQIHCPKLTTITLEDCPLVTSEGVSALASSCPRLQHVNLYGCVLVNDAAILALAQHCPLLCSLVISRTQVSDVGISQLVTGRCSNNLHELEVSGCPMLTDESVKAVLTHCPKIKFFRFHNCPHISNLSLLDSYFENRRLAHLTWTVY